jgi:LmbE family N-acetylglucosaminyl deacetylase
LVVGAHPDDEVLGVGGTIAKHAAEGDEVHILIVTEGATEQYDDEKIVEQKVREARSCADCLGAEAVHFGNLPDMRLDDTPHVEVNAVIEDAIEKVEPDIVYTHSKADVNRDHDAVYKSTMVATRPGTGVERVLAYEVPSSTDWAGGEKSFSPTFYVDIGDFLDTKLDAFAEYDSETRSFPHPRSAKALRSLAKVRGVAGGFSAAEAFVHARERREEL